MELRSVIPTCGWRTQIVRRRWFVMLPCRSTKLWVHFVPAHSPSVRQAFVDEQNKLTMPYLEQCAVRDQFHQRLTELYNYPKYSCPYKRGKRYSTYIQTIGLKSHEVRTVPLFPLPVFRYFYFHNKGLQNQDVLYVQDSLDGPATVFFDPNKLSEDGTVALKCESVEVRDPQWWLALLLPLHSLSLSPVARLSEDCEYFAYGLSSSGSDWVTLHFMKADDDLAKLPDVLERVKFSCLAWTHDARGIFYNCYPSQAGKTDGKEATPSTRSRDGLSGLAFSICHYRHGDNMQPQPKVVLPRHWHQTVWRRPGCRVSRPSKVAQLRNRKSAVIMHQTL